MLLRLSMSVTQIEMYFHTLINATIRFNFDLIYFNSTTAKILMGLFETLDATATAGNSVTILWNYNEDDSNMEELGEEFGEDLISAKFVMGPKS